MTKVLHVVPVNDTKVHAYELNCWCKPLAHTAVNERGKRGTIVCHNAKDCRERFERQGLKTPHGWTVVKA